MKSTDPADLLLGGVCSWKSSELQASFSTGAVFSSATSRKLHILDKHRRLTGWPRGMQSVSGNGSCGPRLSRLAS